MYTLGHLWGLSLGVVCTLTLSGCASLVSNHPAEYADDPGFDATAAVGWAPEAKVEAYLSDYSVTQGDTLYLYANTHYPTYSLRVYQKTPTGVKIVSQFSNIPGVQQEIPPEPYKNCCDWTDPVAIPIPVDLESGLYRIQLTVNGDFSYDRSTLLTFVVREDQPGSTSQIVLLDNAPHHMAYNRWGGASTYWNAISGQPPATAVSVRRPGNHPLNFPEERFMNWAQHMGITLEHLSMMELEWNPEVLFAYQTVAILGHSEYWSRPQRDAIDAFVAGGGNLLVLGGNTMWWQVRFEGDHMVAYKRDVYEDPMLGVRDDLVAFRWHEWPVNDPENRTIGLSFKQGGNINNNKVLPASEGYGGFAVARKWHRYFAGTGLNNGSEFGREKQIVGNEVDGAEFEWVSGMPIPTGYQQTPPSLRILATSPADANGTWLGTGTVAEFHEGNGSGRVFNGATIKWADGLWYAGPLAEDPIVSKITLNVLAEFQPNSAASCPYNIGANDADFDGIDDTCDNCVAMANPDQVDSDANGTGDACEDSVPVRPSIDIKPADDANYIVPGVDETLDVVIFTHVRDNTGPLWFRAHTIDPDSLRLGPGGASASAVETLDYNGDGHMDIKASFNTNVAMPVCYEEDTEALLMITGEAQRGGKFEGLQKAVFAPCNTGCHQ